MQFLIIRFAPVPVTSSVSNLVGDKQINLIMHLVKFYELFFCNKYFNTETSNTIRDVFIEFSLQAPSFFLVRRQRCCHDDLAPVFTHKVRRSSHQLLYLHVLVTFVVVIEFTVHVYSS